MNALTLLHRTVKMYADLTGIYNRLIFIGGIRPKCGIIKYNHYSVVDCAFWHCPSASQWTGSRRTTIGLSVAHMGNTGVCKSEA